MSNNVIDILIVDNEGFIFNVDDWEVLRLNHRIVGSLVGPYPPAPRQVRNNGLPSILLAEEIRLLVENGVCRTVQYPSFTTLPNTEIETLKNIEEQKLLAEKRKEFALEKADFIGKLVVNAILADGDQNCDEVKELMKEVRCIKPFHPSRYTKICLDESCSEVIEVPLPILNTDGEKIRYKVFKDLWSKGYFLSCGLKFGGDFLAYDGDPVLNHSKYIVKCSDCGEEETVINSRVSTITKKKMLIAKEDGDSVKYFTYELSDMPSATKKKIPVRFELK